MKNIRLTIKILGFIIFPCLMVGIFINQIEFEIIMCISLITLFVIEFIYNLIEKKSNVIIFPEKDISRYKRSSIFLLLFGLISIFITIYDNKYELRNLMPAFIFGLLGLRGILFTKQTIKSIRVFEQGFEYGILQNYVRWSRIINYSCDLEENKISIDKKGLLGNSFKIQFKDLTDLKEFEKILIAKK